MEDGLSELLTADFDYALPSELIAQEPLADRAAARMMVVNRRDASLTHAHVSDLTSYLRAGDLLVLNDTRVIPARIYGHKEGTGGRVELLLIEELRPGIWSALCGSSRRPRPGTRLILGGGTITGDVVDLGEGGRMTVALQSDRPILEALEEVGVPPLPPYIKRPVTRPSADVQRDRDDYQTVYARMPGAVAAPTAGLHLTQAMLDQLDEQGIGRAMVTLHVGLGTFKPVVTETVAGHRMEHERFTVPEATADAVNRTRVAGGRIVAVGSTVVRTLEHSATVQGDISAGAGRTDIFIHPPYRFRIIDALLTNFHLPRSTLVMMVSAFAGSALIRNAYAEAVKERYRFYSYGDCMLIL